MKLARGQAVPTTMAKYIFVFVSNAASQKCTGHRSKQSQSKNARKYGFQWCNDDDDDDAQAHCQQCEIWGSFTCFTISQLIFILRWRQLENKLTLFRIYLYNIWMSSSTKHKSHVQKKKHKSRSSLLRFAIFMTQMIPERKYKNQRSGSLNCWVYDVARMN